MPRQQGIDGCRRRPPKPASTQEPDRIKCTSRSFKWTHHLHWSFSRFRSKHSLAADFFQCGKCFRKFDRDTIKVQRGKFIKSALPLTSCLKLDTSFPAPGAPL